TGLWSMRQQARAADVSAPTMVRLARALGFAGYAGFRRPFQEALTGRTAEYGARASALQAAPQAKRIERLAREIAASQIADVESVLALNPPQRLEAAVGAIAAAKRVGFLGVRAPFGIAFQFRYAYNLIARNGVLFDGVGGTVHDQVETLGPDDVLIAISQDPYSTPTVEAVITAAQRGVTVVALTDSALLPLAASGRGIRIVDTAGREYLDASGGAAVSCLGHGHPDVILAMQEQIDRIAYAHTSFFSTAVAEELADHLVAHAPAGLSHVYLVSGGSEAIEAALKLARQYFVEIGQPQRRHFIARRQSYHGNTLGALAVGGNAWRRRQFAPLLIPVTHVSPCYEYRDRAASETPEAYGARLVAELAAAIDQLG